MAYFQGRDVRVAFTTEHYSLGIKNTNGDLAVTGHQDGPTDVGPTDLVKNRFWPMHRGGAASGSDTALGLVDADEVTDTEASTDEINTLSDVTGIDVSQDKVNEDIQYFGQNTMLQAEINNSYTISITRKKSDNVYWLIPQLVKLK